MKYRYILLIFLIITPLLTWSENNYILIESQEKKRLESEPGKIITNAFLLNNISGKSRTVTQELVLPPNWKEIITDTSFVINKKAWEIKIVCFYIPVKALAGDYEVLYSVKDTEKTSPGAFMVIPITVLPIKKVTVTLLNAPLYAISGDSYQTAFVVSNEGNTNINVSYKIKSGEDFPFSIVNIPNDPGIFCLSSGESRILEIDVETIKGIRNSFKHLFQLIVEITENNPDIDSHISDAAISNVEIIPVTGQEGDIFYRLPVKIDVKQSNEIKEEWDKELIVKVSGDGSLDEAGNNYIQFLINKELDLEEPSFFETGDIYSLYYYSNPFELYVGDFGLSLSPLVEDYQYGRGIMSEVNFGIINFGGYYQQPLAPLLLSQNIGGFVNYILPGNDDQEDYIYTAELNYSHIIEQSMIFGLYQEYYPIKSLSLELEVALGNRFDSDVHDAYLFRGNGTHDWINYSLSAIYASPLFPGAIKDLYSIEGGLGFQLLGDSLKFGTSLIQEQHNVQLNTAISDAPLSRNLQLFFDYFWDTMGTEIFCSWDYLTSIDILPQHNFENQINIFLTSIRQPIIQSLTLYTFAKLSLKEDLLLKKNSIFQRYLLGITHEPDKGPNYDLFLSYNHNSYTTEKIIQKIDWGISVAIPLKNLQLNTSFNNTFTIQENQLYRTMFDLSASLAFNLGDLRSITGDTRWSMTNLDTTFSSWKNEFIINLEFHTVIGIPVNTKKSIGKVRGIIYDEITKQPLSDVILRLGGRTSISDKSGKFSFNGLKPGVYYLKVDRNKIGANRIPVQDSPIEVNIESGRVTKVEIGIIDSVTISGRITFFGNKKNNAEEYIFEEKMDKNKEFVELYDIQGVVVEITNGEETKRQISGKDGCFIFEELLPGKWTLTIRQNSLPVDHYWEKDRIELELNEGKMKDVLLKILSREWNITIINEGETLIEE